MLRSTLIPAILVVLAALVAAAAAQGQDTRNQILRECQNGALTGDYSAREIRDARNNIPDDVDQYSDCRDVLTRALLDLTGSAGGGTGDPGTGIGGAAGSTGTGGTVGGLTPATDADRQAIEQAAADGGAPVEVGGRRIVPGAAGFDSGAARNTLPSTLVALLLLFGAAAMIASAPFVRRRALGPLGSTIRRLLPG